MSEPQTLYTCMCTMYGDISYHRELPCAESAADGKQTSVKVLNEYTPKSIKHSQPVGFEGDSTVCVGLKCQHRFLIFLVFK